jgi:N utilization substance protein B
MAARHRSRQRALQVLFQWDMRKQAVEEAIRSFYDSVGTEEVDDPAPDQDVFMETLATGTTRAVSGIDARIGEKAANWTLERMPVVDRNILRLAIFEMTHLGTPPAIAIDEALELARQFAGDESVSFINGVLDAVNKDLHKDADA